MRPSADVPLVAEQGILALHVKDPGRRPLVNVHLATEGDGSVAAPTDRAGKTRLRLAVGARAGSLVTLQVVYAEQDLVFISPWDNRVQVPDWDDRLESYVSIVLAERGDRLMLENGTAVAALAAQINRVNAPKNVGEQSTEAQRRENLEKISRSFGLRAEEVDHAIRAWGEKANDPYEKGLAALYEQNYPEASKQLADSLQSRKNAEAKAQADVANAAFFLGQSLYEQGRYRESAAAYSETLQRLPADSIQPR